MGADIYLQSIHNQRTEEFGAGADTIRSALKVARQAGVPEDRLDSLMKRLWAITDKVDEGCYFRDSYNYTNLLWKLGISWWQDVGDRLDDDGNLDEDGCKWLLEAMTAQRSLIPESVKELYEDKNKPLDTEEELNEWFQKKFDNLAALLSKAIELHEPILCSI